MTNRVGQQLGNYRLTRLLGHGGFADVYLGEHVHLGTYAAIKVLQTQLGNNFLEAFRAEARIIAHLEHPHIVRVLEFGIEDAFPFLVMDYAPHGTLRHRHIKGTLLPPEFILPYVKQVAAALDYAHDSKLIHRDVKPENILVGRRGTILLSDFGIAVAAHRTQSMSLQNEAGTVSYMAPEQIQGKARPASDQYSLGAVVYEWLSGRPPFEGTTVVEIAMKHLSDPPPPLRQAIPTVSPAVEQVICRVLAKDPQQRFPRVQDFATALEEAIRERRSPVLAPQPPLPSQRTASSTVKGTQLPLNHVIQTGSAQLLAKSSPPFSNLPPPSPVETRPIQPIKTQEVLDNIQRGNIPPTWQVFYPRPARYFTSRLLRTLGILLLAGVLTPYTYSSLLYVALIIAALISAATSWVSYKRCLLVLMPGGFIQRSGLWNLETVNYVAVANISTSPRGSAWLKFLFGNYFSTKGTLFIEKANAPRWHRSKQFQVHPSYEAPEEIALKIISTYQQLASE